MSRGTASLATLAAPLLLSAAYLAVSLDHVTVFPAVTDDEVWIASSAQTLVEKGVYGSPLITGLHGGERHTYHHMPLYPLLLAALVKVVGPGVLALRLLPVACGLAVLLLTVAAGNG